MGRRNQRKLSVVIPLHNEGGHFERSCEAIRSQLVKLPCRYQLLLVDDGSTDNTWEVASELARQHSGVSALRLSRNFGKEAAISAGLENALGDALIVMDADLQHPPELIPEMYRLWAEEGIDIVDAVKADRGPEPLLRRWGAGVFNYLLNRLSGFNMSGASDFKLLDRRVVDAWQGMSETQLFYRGMIAWLGFRRAEILFDVTAGQARSSAWSFTRLAIFALSALTSFSSAPLQIVTVLGVLFFITAAVLGGRTLYLWFTGEAVSGFTTVILLQLIIGGCVMTSLGVIGHYLSNIFLEVKRRPRYVIAESATAESAAARAAAGED